jgi:zinc protease
MPAGARCAEYPALADKHRARGCISSKAAICRCSILLSIFPPAAATIPPASRASHILTHGLLDQGAGGLSDTEIAHRLADSGAILGGRFDRDRAGVTLRTLSSLPEREIALDVLTRVLQQPAFDPDVLSREKRRLVGCN